MNNFLKTTALLILIFVFFPTALFGQSSDAQPVVPGSPMGEMQSTITELVNIVESLPGDNNLETRRGKLRETIEPKFDFKEMAKRSLGAHWLKINVEQRNEFVSAFSDLLARTYLSRIENVGRGMVSVESEKIKAPKAYVKTMVNYKGDIFPIDYRLLERNKHWMVYDVIIENIGLVANYRNEFAGIIRKEKFSGLMKRLHDKQEKNEKRDAEQQPAA